MPLKTVLVFRYSAICIGLILGICLTEILLRIDRPAISMIDIEKSKQGFAGNKRQIIVRNLVNTGLSNPKLDTIIYRSINNIKFRGPDLPLNSANLYKVFAIGGSTTICEYLSDGEDWPNILGKDLVKVDSSIWVNNAGLDGQSTFGHIKTLKEVVLPLHPQMILFLIGCNDVERDSARFYDEVKYETHTLPIIYKYSYLYRAISNIYWSYRNKYFQKNFKVYHQNLDFKNLRELFIETCSEPIKNHLDVNFTKLIKAAIFLLIL